MFITRLSREREREKYRIIIPHVRPETISVIRDAAEVALSTTRDTRYTPLN